MNQQRPFIISIAKMFGLLKVILIIQCFSVVWATDGTVIDDTGCPKVFEAKCHCGKQSYELWNPDRDVYVVNCTNAGFTNTSMLEWLPHRTEVLLFNGNNIPFWDWNVFGVWNEHDDLEVIDLSNNQIEEILGKSFHKVSSVKRLVLNHNNLKISGHAHHRRLLTNFYNLEELHLTNTFTEIIDSKWSLDDLKDIFLASNMNKLWKLHLEQNEIWSVAKNMFCDLPGLQDLYLGDNQLSGVDFDLECITNLRFLDLQYNKIKRLDQKTINRLNHMFLNNLSNTTEGALTRPKKVNLYKNPFVCDCHFKKMFNWIKNDKSILHQKDKLRCYTGLPAYNGGLPVLKVRKLDCPDTQTFLKSGKSTATHTLLTLIIVLMVTLLFALLYFNRARVTSNVRPLVANFQRSMQYKTIEKSVLEATNGEINTISNSSYISHSLPPEAKV